MAILENANQYKYTGRGPYDAKSLVKTYADLLSESTWKSSANKIIAYNGMIVAVWLDKEDNTRNGIYYLHDATITSTFTAPNVTDPANWHKISDKVDLSSIEDRLTALESKKEITYAEFDQLPTQGETNHLYIVLDKKASYIWNGSEYVCIGSQVPDIEVICGGDAR